MSTTVYIHRTTHSLSSKPNTGVQANLRQTSKRLKLVYSSNEIFERAKSGEPLAQAEYGLRLLTGNEVVKNKQQGCQWVRLAAKQGHAMGQFLLGSCYYNGDGVLPNPLKAFFWFSLAADQHIKEAITIRRLMLPQLSRAERQDIKVQLAAWRPVNYTL